MFKKTMVLFLTAALLIFTASAASASGIFSEMNETEYADERLPVLDEVADTIAVSQTEGSVTVEVSQAYYEGNRVYISYRSNSQILEQDGLDLEDGTYADIIAGGSVEKEDGTFVGWKECIVDEDHPGNTQTFCLVYSIPGKEEKQRLSFSLKYHEYDHCLEGFSPATTYQAQATLTMGKVSLKGIIKLDSPEQAASWLAWQEGEDGTGTDVIVCWNLYQNGELVSYDLFGAASVFGTEGVNFEVMYPCVEDISGLVLVPEYSEAGEKTDEAIALEPAGFTE